MEKEGWFVSGVFWSAFFFGFFFGVGHGVEYFLSCLELWFPSFLVSDMGVLSLLLVL